MVYHELINISSQDTILDLNIFENKIDILEESRFQETKLINIAKSKIVSDNFSPKNNNVNDLNLLTNQNNWLNSYLVPNNNKIQDSVAIQCDCPTCDGRFIVDESELELFPAPLNSAPTISSSLPQDIIDSLLTRHRWTDKTITYSFYEDDVFDGDYYYNETGVREVSEGIKANVREILELVETFVDLDFIEVNESETGTYGEIRYMLSNNPGYAYAYLPYGSSFHPSGDVHLKPTYDHKTNLNGFQNDPGKHGYTTLIHETFHALGLEHPHGGTVLDPLKDNLSNTVMTYDFKGNSPATAMPYDIAALQQAYGVADNNVGNDTYIFGATTDVFTVDGQSSFTTSHRVKQTIWDSYGIDTLDFSNLNLQSNGYLFDLNEGGWLVAKAQDKTNNAGERYYNYGTSLAYDMTIENVVGSSSDDTIVANAAANIFSGYTVGIDAGNDTLIDTDESDTLDLSSYSSLDVTQTQSGEDLVINLGSDGSVTVKDYYAVSEANRLNLLFETIAENIAEVGKITNLNHNEQTIQLQNDYVNPVVFAQPLSYNGADPAIARITDINATDDTVSFRVQEAEYKDGWHAPESFSYMVVEAGMWQLEDGTLLEVDTVDTNQMARNATSGWENVNFTHDFTETPVVLSQVQTNNGSQFVRTRQNNADTNGFSVTLEEEEALKNSGHVEETIGWLAIDSGSGNWDEMNYQARSTGNAVNQDWYQLDLSDFATTPNLLASIATYNGADPSGLRHREISGADSSTIEIKIEEDESVDTETWHLAEEVHLLAIEGSGILTARSYDPLNEMTIIESNLVEDSLAVAVDPI